MSKAAIAELTKNEQVELRRLSERPNLNLIYQTRRDFLIARKTGISIYELYEQRSKRRLNVPHKCTPEHRARLFEEQNGCCAICARSSIKLVVDHDHKTGWIRSLLCLSCNSRVGWFECGHPNSSARAARYSREKLYVEHHETARLQLASELKRPIDPHLSIRI